MANIVRCVLPDGVHRFKPFTVADYRDFLLVRNDMNSKTPEEQEQSLNEMIEDYFPDIRASWRPYVFLRVFTSSIGKTKIPVAYECPKCQAHKKTLFNIKQDDLTNPSIELAGIKINFNFPENDSGDLVELIQDNIHSVSDSDGTYNWEDLSSEEKLSVVDAIDADSFEKIVKQMKPIYFELRMGCCDKRTITYSSILDLFKLLIHPDEVFTFYQINHVLVKNSYTLDSVMNMLPVERNIALSLIEKDIKK